MFIELYCFQNEFNSDRHVANCNKQHQHNMLTEQRIATIRCQQ